MIHIDPVHRAPWEYGLGADQMIAAPGPVLTDPIPSPADIVLPPATQQGSSRSTRTPEFRKKKPIKLL